MVDLHCHILPKVDDGPATLDETLTLARFCVADGIKHVVATPHCHRYVHLLRADVLPQVAQLNSELESAAIPLAILPGSEIQVTDATAYRREFEAGLYCHLGDGRAFTLLEFNWAREQFPPDAASLIDWIRDTGHDPHPGSSRTTRLFLERPRPLAGFGRGWSVGASNGGFAAGQPWPGPQSVRGSHSAGVSRRGAGDRRPQYQAMFWAVVWLCLGPGTPWSTAGCRYPRPERIRY